MRLNFTAIVLFLVSAHLFSQQAISKEDRIFSAAQKALAKKDTLAALNLLEESIRINNYAPSYFELAKILWNKNTYTDRYKACEYAKQASLLDKEIKDYEILYAEYSKQIALKTGEITFKGVVNKTIKNFEAKLKNGLITSGEPKVSALLAIAELKSKEFAEWDKSHRRYFIKDSISPFVDTVDLSLQKFADEDFKNAEEYYLKAYYEDSLSYDVCLNIGLFYARFNNPSKGIPHLERIIKLNRADKNIYLCLGLLYYKVNKISACYEAYSKALKLMEKNEYEDFTLNSLKMLMTNEEGFDDSAKGFEFEQIINSFWKRQDPLMMTEYNERLLEHYTRVALANLSFGDKQKNVIGWKTSRGETLVRYGEPLNRIRIRADPEQKTPKSEEYHYWFGRINFITNWSSSHFRFENYRQIEILRKQFPTSYTPRFEGPVFNTFCKTYQFKSFANNSSDIYLVYMINPKDSSTLKKFFEGGFTEKLFLVDRDNNKLGEKTKQNVQLLFDDKPVVYFSHIKSKPNGSSISLELFRNKDNGVSVFRTQIENIDYYKNQLFISNLAICFDVADEQKQNEYIQRAELFILPNPTNYFSNDIPMYIYFEAYGLMRNQNNLFSFEQKVTVEKIEKENSDFENLLDEAGKLLGLKKNIEKITLTNNYQSIEQNPQAYFQLDMSKYETGNYRITVTIKDKETGQEATNNSTVYWKNTLNKVTKN